MLMCSYVLVYVLNLRSVFDDTAMYTQVYNLRSRTTKYTRKIKKKTTSHFDSDTPKRNNNNWCIKVLDFNVD